MGRASGRQGRAGARFARGRATRTRRDADRRADRARLRTRLSRLPLPWLLAQGPSAVGEIPRGFRRRRPGFRRDRAAGLTPHSVATKMKSPGPYGPGLLLSGLPDRSEVDVHAAADDVRPEPHIVADRAVAVETAVEAADVVG